MRPHLTSVDTQLPSKSGSSSDSKDVGEAPRILFVDDEPQVLRTLKRFSLTQNWTVFFAESGEAGLDLLRSGQEVDIVVSDMRMPRMSGSEFLQAVKSEFPFCVRMLLTGYSDTDTLKDAINGARIYNYLTKPWDETMLSEVIDGAFRFRKSERERRRLEDLTHDQNRKLCRLALSLDRQVKERTEEIERAKQLLQESHDRKERQFQASLTVLNHLIEWREGRDSGHSRFVVSYAEKLARQLKMRKQDVDDIQLASLYHRIGILGLPDELRTRPVAGFSDSEHALYEKVPVWGEQALVGIPELADAARLIRHQHERIDGGGYPDSLKGVQVPVGSQIIGMLSDYYDCRNGRLVSGLSGADAAGRYIAEHAGSKYDIALVQLFSIMLDESGDMVV